MDKFLIRMLSLVRFYYCGGVSSYPAACVHGLKDGNFFYYTKIWTVNKE